ncbi:MAG TPA: hypothetical protein VGB15_02100 [Longimicrobium sp.]|jgi:hypothetical protein
MPFPVIVVPDDAAESAEWMGTKQKFWYVDPTLGRSLFKLARPGSGEDWSERVACEIADLLGIPHARYELALWAGSRGTVTPSLLGESETLIHGNELLATGVSEYPALTAEARFRNSQHTLEAVLSTLRSNHAGLPVGYVAPAGINSAEDLFAGYLMFDALIGNTDRHHENWAVIQVEAADGTAVCRLSPTYDHASSLGRNETEANILRRLTTRDAGYSVSAYATRAASALYLSAADRKPLSTFDAFVQARTMMHEASDAWLERLGSVDVETLVHVVDEVPADRLSSDAAKFVQEIIRFNYTRLTALR